MSLPTTQTPINCLEPQEQVNGIGARALSTKISERSSEERIRIHYGWWFLLFVSRLLSIIICELWICELRISESSKSWVELLLRRECWSFHDNSLFQSHRRDLFSWYRDIILVRQSHSRIVLLCLRRSVMTVLRYFRFIVRIVPHHIDI